MTTALVQQIKDTLRADANGVVRVDSRVVAERFGKQHGHVLRDIDDLMAQAPSIASNFGATSYEVAGPNGGSRRAPCYEMNRDGFSLLVMGFTGKPALDWKLKFIEAFNLMEAELKKQAAAFDPSKLSRLEILRMAMESEQRAVEMEKLAAENDQRAAIASHRAEIAEETNQLLGRGSQIFTLTDAAKHLNLTRTKFLAWANKKFIYRDQFGKWQAYQTMISRGYMDHVNPFLTNNGWVYQCIVTAKGLVFLTRQREKELKGVTIDIYFQ